MRVDVVIAQARHDHYIWPERFPHARRHHVVELEDLFGCSREISIDIMSLASALWLATMAGHLRIVAKLT
jgi:hypothetical protein